METIENAMLEEIYIQAQAMARARNQTISEKNNYCITLEQLEAILKSFES